MARGPISSPVTHSLMLLTLLLHIFRRLQIAAKFSHGLKVLLYSYFEIPHMYV